MRPDEIRFFIRKQPFEPFRVFVSDGSSFDVIHHDFMIVLQHKVIVALAKKPGDIPKESAFIDPLHITRIEPLNGNGKGTIAKKRKGHG